MTSTFTNPRHLSQGWSSHFTLFSSAPFSSDLRGGPPPLRLCADTGPGSDTPRKRPRGGRQISSSRVLLREEPGHLQRSPRLPMEGLLPLGTTLVSGPGPPWCSRVQKPGP
ncbi:hypothetical protein DPEC_G00273190 [Dallia pectoralis]|uniref:Uncharacterized protein n=1 Tax=Dallia pectoralis TaxID=75939 RepID=A0ACC2FQB5_DALPE|nr:hypothetical protein DPEC_G00273190 [Dallia pectoralis]